VFPILLSQDLMIHLAYFFVKIMSVCVSNVRMNKEKSQSVLILKGLICMLSYTLRLESRCVLVKGVGGDVHEHPYRHEPI
jgi:hypothetical protein